MTPHPTSKDGSAFLWAILSCLAGIGLLALQKWLKLEGEASFVTLLVLPLVVYLALSGRLTEFKAGPIEAKLRELAGKTVGASQDFLAVGDEVGTIVEGIEAVTKGNPSRLPHALEVLDRERPPVLHLTLGQQYIREDLARYLDTLSQLRRFKFVVVARKSGEVFCYIPHYTLRHLLTLSVRTDAFLGLIRDGREDQLKDYPGMRATFLTPASTMKEALAAMTEKGLESLLVRDDGGRLAGVVERDQVVGKLLLGLAS